MLKIKDLRAGVTGKEILKGLNLEVLPGQVHAIMGINGSGKSTLASILAGREGYEVTAGQVLFKGHDLLELDPEVRAREGLFLAFQYPVELPGVLTTYFLRTALNAVRAHRGQPAIGVREFATLAREKADLLELDESFLKRSVNEGFSGGEKKRNEVFQMSLLDPCLAILDETDSGLDIDALKVVAGGVNRLRSPERSFVVITHYQRLLDYIVPDVIHVMIDGQIVATGGIELAERLEKGGYGSFKDGSALAA